MNANPQTPKPKDSGRIWAGVIIIAFGFILLSKQFNWNIYFPYWMTSGKMIIVLIGLIIGATSNFKNPASYVLIAIGSILIIKDQFQINLWKTIFPVAIMAVGIWLLTDRPTKKIRTRKTQHSGFQNQKNPLDWDARQSSYSSQDTRENDSSSYTGFENNENTAQENQQQDQNYSGFSNAEYVKSTAIFSEVRKIIVTKNFRGANLVNIFGGTDINLMQTDLEEPVIIEVFQIFAGTKIIVPSNWRVISEVVSIFGEVDDRRFVMGNFKDDHKVVYLRGTSVFGGITIKSM